MESNNLFPVFFKLENLRLLIVGGGNVGLEKLNAVLANSPQTRIWLIGKEISGEIRKKAKDYPNILLFERSFNMKDLYGKDLVILATDDRLLHEQIKKETARLNIMTNVADTPDLCDFYLGSIVQKGDLKIAISTNGKSPTLAKRFREILEDAIPGSVQGILNNLQVIRARLTGDFQEKVRVLNKVTTTARNDYQ